MNNYKLDLSGFTLLNNKKTKSRNILTQTGISLNLSENLNIKVLDKEGNIFYKKCKNLEIGDICFNSIKNNFFSKENTIEEKKAYVIGFLYSFKVINNLSVIKLFMGDISDYLGDFLYRYFNVKRYSNFYELKINENFLIENNINSEHIPNQIIKNGKEVQIAFLRGFFDLNSIIYENQIIKDSYSNSLLKEISLMLRNFGIITEVDEYDMFINGQQIIYFYNMIGTNNFEFEESLLSINLLEKDFFEILILKDLVAEFLKTTDSDLDINSIRLTRLNILNLLKLEGNKDIKKKLESLITGNICFDEIVSIEDCNLSVDINEDCLINSFNIQI